MALLPRALHSSALTFVGNYWIAKLRAEIMCSLRFDRTGANPFLRLGFVCHLAIEPGFFVAWRVFQSVVLTLQQNRSVRHCWGQYLVSDYYYHMFGPFGNFLQTIKKLGWTLQDEGALDLGSGLVLSLCNTDVAQWKWLFEWYW